MSILMIVQLVLALIMVEAKKMITTPKNSVFTHVPTAGWK